MESYFWNGHGPGFMTVSVEIEMEDTDDHPMSMKEVQVFTIDTDNVPETWEIIVENPTNG